MSTRFYYGQLDYIDQLNALEDEIFSVVGSGAVLKSGSAMDNGAQLIADEGTVTSPGLGVGVLNSGLYSVGTDVYVTTNGTNAVKFNSTTSRVYGGLQIDGTLSGAGATALLNAANAYADSLVVTLWDDRGNYDASSNVFPSSGGSGSAGAVLKNDIWTISVAGTLGGVPVVARQTVRALANAPGQTSSNWAIGLANTDIDDSITDGVIARAPSQNAVFDALALKAPLASPTFTGTNTLQNETFSGTGGRIKADFSNGTISNRLLFQTTTTNGFTSVGTVPSGTSTRSGFAACNAADPNNSSIGGFECDANGVNIISSLTGTGSQKPIRFMMGTPEYARFDPAGNFGIGVVIGSGNGYAGDTTSASNATFRLYDTVDGFTKLVNNYASGGIQQFTNGALRSTLDANGNFGLGVAPSSWGSSWKAFDIGAATGIAYGFGETDVTNNAYRTNAGSFVYKTTAAASSYNQSGGQHLWYTAPSGSAGAAISMTQAMTLDVNGLTLNSTLLANGPSATGVAAVYDSTAGAGSYTAYKSSNNTYAYIGTSQQLISGGATQDLAIRAESAMVFGIGSAEGMRLDNSKNLLVGVTSGSFHIVQKTVTNDGGQGIFGVLNGSGITAVAVAAVTGTGYSATSAAIYVNKSANTSRSINAAGTINASGADYAEYMRKINMSVVFAKGAIVGINADGFLTDKWADSVSFMVKSTSPSYVGGDDWSQHLGPRPQAPAEDSSEEDKEAFELALAEYEVALEEARQWVDRIAYAGQVPVNVNAATPGQYIVPVQDGEGIKGVAVSEGDITFAQYRKAIGIVQNILPDGRANVRVKPV